MCMFYSWARRGTTSCTQAVEIEGISQSSNASLKKKKKKKTGLKKKQKTNTKKNQGGVQKQGGKKDRPKKKVKGPNK